MSTSKNTKQAGSLETPRMTLMVGPCVIEGEAFTLEVAQELRRQLEGLPIDCYFKASFDKANRTSGESFRGPGLEEGLRILSKVKTQTQFKIITDFHSPDQAEPVAEVADFLQVPAFLCRQTDMIEAGVRACVAHGKKLNVKKGQFLAPWDARNIVEKIRSYSKTLGHSASDFFTITERGVSFGYNYLVVDMTSFKVIQGYGVPVIYDATHSVQLPGNALGGKATGGRREMIEVLARAAIAAGADGIFMECHPQPEVAKSDGPNAFYLDQVGKFVRQLLEIRSVVKKLPEVLPTQQKTTSLHVDLAGPGNA